MSSIQSSLAGEVFILRGLPGSGKSTLATSLAGRRGVICSADEFLVDRTGEYRHDPRRQGFAHMRCFQKFTAAVHAGVKRIIVDNTNTRRREFSRYQKLAEQSGYRVHVLTVENYHGGLSRHAVPADVINDFEHRFTIRLR